MGTRKGPFRSSARTSELDPSTGPWLVADIGGGSTELAAGAGVLAAGRVPPEAGPAPPEAVRSLDVGCVRITERFLASDPPTPAELAAARSCVAGLLEQASRELPALGRARTLVGLAGTVAALAAIEQGLTTYQRDRVHHFALHRDMVTHWLDVLAAEPAAARRVRPGVETDRADVIVGGIVVLAELMRHFGFDECLTSEADILDGLVISLRSG